MKTGLPAPAGCNKSPLPRNRAGTAGETAQFALGGYGDTAEAAEIAERAARRRPRVTKGQLLVPQGARAAKVRAATLYFGPAGDSSGRPAHPLRARTAD